MYAVGDPAPPIVPCLRRRASLHLDIARAGCGVTTAGLLRGVAHEPPSRDAQAALEAFAASNGWRLAA